MDKIMRAISEKHNFKIAVVELATTMNEIISRQQLSPPVALALSKLTVGNVLMGVEMKNGETITSNWRTSDGMVKTMISEFANQKVRSCARFDPFDWEALVENQQTGTLLQQMVGREGSLVVRRDLGLKEPYYSHTDIVDADIDMTLISMLRNSTQVGCFLTTKIDFNNDFTIKHARGLLVQMLPGFTDENIDFLDKKMGSKQTIDEWLLSQEMNLQMFNSLHAEIKMLSKESVKFECSCSVDKSLQAIGVLGQKQILEIVDKQQDIEVVCQFCLEKRMIELEKIRQLLIN